MPVLVLSAGQVRLDVRTAVPGEVHHTVGVGEREWLQEHRIYDAEDRAVGTDSECQRQDDSGREVARLEPRPETARNVLPEPVPAPPPAPAASQPLVDSSLNNVPHRSCCGEPPTHPSSFAGLPDLVSEERLHSGAVLAAEIRRERP